jgi:cytochrome d ubiquinol oxidase subunit I
MHMHWDAEMLARVQFALTAMFHYLYPPLTIGLAWLMVMMEALHLKTGQAVYESMAKFWTRIFAATFAMGVTTGIVMEFEFGTNWAAYSRFVGDVFGSPLAAEALLSFFLESTFLGVLVFGWNRVSKRVHLFAATMVAVGATLSALWIVVANSWQHTPAGYHIVGEGFNARAEITSFWAMFFNPSSMGRYLHVLLAAFVQAAFFVMGISAYYVLKNRHLDFAKRSFRMALVFGLVSSVLLLGAGHGQAMNIARNQPAKLAAFEGHFRTEEGGTPLYLFGIPDAKAERVRYGIGIPGFLSFLAYMDFNRPVTALDAFPIEDQPPVAIPFQSYHLMITLGMAFIGLTLLGTVLWWRGTLFEQRWLLWVFVMALPAPYLANSAGWVAAEVGRQPWIVQGLLRTRDGLSESVSAGQVLGSLLMFTAIYSLLFVLYVFILREKIRKGPEPVDTAAA